MGLRHSRRGPQENDWVLVHDAARPCLPRADLDRLIEEIGDDAVGGILAAPLGDTISKVRPPAMSSARSNDSACGAR